MRKQHTQSVFCLTLALGLSFCPTVAKTEASAPQQRLQQLRNNIDETRQDLDSNKKQQQQQQQQLRKLEKEIASLSRAQQKTQRKLKQQKNKQQQLNRETSTQRKSLNNHQHNLNQQIRTAYAAGQQQQLKLLLNQNTPAATGRSMSYYNYFSRAQIETIEQTQSNIKKLNAAETQLQKSNDKLKQLKQQQQQQHVDLQQHQSQRKALISQLNNKISNKQQRLEQLLEDEKALGKLLQNLPTQKHDIDLDNLGKLKGKLKWPTKGKIKNQFGSPRNQGQLKWQGVTINGKAGQEIRSIASGKVIFADWIRGYGLMLIVDHNNGYMSLYGHNQSLYKDVGDTITSNETIATLGNSGGKATPSLYFEMRHKGKPINPATWCR